MSPSFLVVATDPVIESLVGELVGFAGHQPKYLSHDQTVAAAIRSRPSFGVLLDASESEREVDAAARVAREYGVVVVYFASSMSSGELRAFAEQRRAPWFSLPNGPKLLARVLDQAMRGMQRTEEAGDYKRAGARSSSEEWVPPRKRLDDSPRAFAAALVATQRAQLLVAHAQLVREETLL